MKIHSTITLALFLSGLLSVQASAASQCKGLDNESCITDENCGWVEAYTRKDGREVKAFCRTSAKVKKIDVVESSQQETDKS